MGMRGPARWLSLLIAVGWLVGCASAVGVDRGEGSRETTRAVARQILADRDLDDVLQRAHALIASGFNAGSGYPELWIRDFATFMELSCRVHDRTVIRNHLLLLAKFQRDDGDIPDGVVPRDQPPAPNPSADGAPRLTTQLTLAREVITNPLVPDHVGFKISVETDQETSLVQAVATYVRETGDASILHEQIYGRTLLDRMEASLDFLLRHRYSERYGLVRGGTTIDWGDVAPEDPIGAVLNGRSHRAVDVYDNAMLLIAIRDLLPLVKTDSARVRKWEHVERGIRRNIRKHLWDGAQGKFIPHLYLDGSPFPADFDERAIWYHGGTAVAIQAGLLSHDEIASSLQAIRLNVRQARGTTLGVTNYPPYPKGLFQNPHVDPGMYQNGGDWDWFGARMVQALTANDFGADAYVELLPIVQRVQRHGGFFEWFDGQDTPRGSGAFRGSAGQIGKAILALRAWAEAKLDGAAK